MKTTFFALYGLIRHELKFELKSGLLYAAIIFPIVMTLLFGFIISFQGVPPKGIPVGIYQEEGIVLGNKLLVDSTETIQIAEYSSIQTLEQAIKQDQIVAGIVIEQASSDISITIMVDDTKSGVARAAVSAITRLIAGLSPDSDSSSQLLTIKGQFGFDIESEDYFLKLLGPAVIMMIIIYSALLIHGYVIATERENNTIFELALAPVPSWVIIIGKLMAGLLTLLIQVTLAYLIIIFVINPETKGNFFEILVIALITGSGLIGMMFVATSYVKNFQSLRLILGLPVFFPLIFLSGIFYPVEALPNLLQNISQFIPTTWATDTLKGIIYKGRSLLDFPNEMILLISWAVGTLILGSLSLRRILRDN